jgi:hypothetical protein
VVEEGVGLAVSVPSAVVATLPSLARHLVGARGLVRSDKHVSQDDFTAGLGVSVVDAVIRSVTARVRLGVDNLTCSRLVGRVGKRLSGAGEAEQHHNECDECEDFLHGGTLLVELDRTGHCYSPFVGMDRIKMFDTFTNPGRG